LATLPLNWDDFTDELLLLVNTQTCIDFFGMLDSNGANHAKLCTNILQSQYIGMEINFAYCLDAPFDFVSNPVKIEIVP